MKQRSKNLFAKVPEEANSSTKTANKTQEKPYAVVEVGGSQQLVSVGDKITVNMVNCEEGKEFTVDKVLMTINGEKFEIGNPYIKGRVAVFKVVEKRKGKKVTVIKFRAKARYRRKKGHRQPLSVLELTKIADVLKTENKKQGKEDTKK